MSSVQSCIFLLLLDLLWFTGKCETKGVLVGSNAGVMSVEFDTEVWKSIFMYLKQFHIFIFIFIYSLQGNFVFTFYVFPFCKLCFGYFFLMLFFLGFCSLYSYLFMA